MHARNIVLPARPPRHRAARVRSRAARAVAASTVIGLLAALSVVLPIGPAQAVTVMALSKQADTSILVGEQIGYTLTARNDADQGDPAPLYNLSFRDHLPTGATYVAGSSRPTSLGEPTIATVSGRQVLIWSNVSDLPVGAAQTLTFKVTPSTTTFRVGSVVQNTGQAYANADPRTVPRFDVNGTYTSGATAQTTSGTASTSVAAIKVKKSEPSPEGELLRGVHSHSTVYTVTTTNNTVATTSSVTLTDYLPAGLEFLGCGTVDNSSATELYPGAREYVGAPSLAAVPDLTTDCPAPTSVTTVKNPAGHPAGVYTRVEWNLASLVAGQVKTVTYRAGIPQRQNVDTWPGTTPPGPGLGQIANLDNNTGPSTRETASEISYTNTATVSGTYTGVLAGGAANPVVGSDQVTVTSEDVSLQKSISAGAFSHGGTATYSLTVNTGEYADAVNIVLTDLLPDGLCPLSDAPVGDTCGAGAAPTGADYDSVTRNPDGTHTIVFTPIASMAASSVRTVTFQARMQSSYDGSGDPTVSGDSYVNNVSLTATSRVLPGVAAPAPTGNLAVTDASSASVGSDAPTLTKKIQPMGAGTYSCSGSASDYRDDVAPTQASLTFHEGDRVCFLLRVDFSGDNSTKNAVVTDFLPPGMTYLAGSAQPTTTGNTVTAALSSTDPVTFQVGTVDGTDRFVAPGGVFQYVVAATVGAPAYGPAPDLTGNLAKLTWESTGGQVGFLRDDVGLGLAAAPPAGITKAAARLTPTPGALTNGAVVRGSQTVRYTVTATNESTAGNRDQRDIVGPEIWDALPAGVTCAMVSAVDAPGVCRDSGDPGYPSLRSGLTGRSVLVWDLPDTVVLRAAQTPKDTVALTYVIAFPDSFSARSVLTNNAAVTSYDSPTNTGGVVAHQPRSNINAAVTSPDSAVAEATFTVNYPTPVATKSAVTSIVADNNNAANQATVGETVRYTYDITVPAHTTLYKAVLSDVLPAGLVALDGTAEASYCLDTGTCAPTDRLTVPAGFSLGNAGTSTGTLTFATPYQNGSDVDQRFIVSMTARMTDTGSHGSTRVNTAQLASFPTATATTAYSPHVTATSTVTLVLPAPTLTKTTNASGNLVTADQNVTYTLTAANSTSGRPPLHDSFVVDCIPTGLTYTVGSASPALHTVPVAGDGSNGCAIGTTRLEWYLDDVATGTPAQRTMTYRAVVSSAAAGLTTYINSARFSGSTLDDNDKTSAQDPDNPLERAIAATTTRTVTVVPATSAKSATQNKYIVGETGRWTVSLGIPAMVNYYDSALIDQLPAGIDPASLHQVSFTCTYPGGAACTLPAGAGIRLTDRANSPTAGATTVGWLVGDLLSDAQDRTITLVYTGRVDQAIGTNVAGKTLTNSATIRWARTDGAAPTDAGATFQASSIATTATVTVTEPSLSVTKSVTDATPAPGDTFGYTVRVTNATGSNVSAAHDAVVVDTVPAGVVVDPSTISASGSITGRADDGTGGIITWNLTGPLAPTTSTLLTYSARLTVPAPVAKQTNTARITDYYSLAAASGRRYTGPSATADVTAALPHLSVVKTVTSPTTAYIGESTGWRIAVTSDGDSRAYAVDVDDVLPPGWRYDAGSAQVTVAGVPLSGAGTEPVVASQPAGDALAWTDLGNLPVGTALVVTFTAKPTSGVVSLPGVGSSVHHVNSAVADGDDAVGTNYPATASTAQVQVHSADLRLTKTHTGAVVAGDELSWHLDVVNAGPDASVGPFRVVDTLPSGTTYVSATGSGWTCVPAEGVVTCDRPAGTPVAAGGSLPRITVVARLANDLAEGRQLTNEAIVSARTYDAQPGNNTGTENVTVTTRADLAVAKAVQGAHVAGERWTWKVTTTNNGPSIARGPITVTDTLPAGVTGVQATGTGWACTVDGDAGTVTCTRATDLAVAASSQITLSAIVPASRLADVTNTVRVSAATTDPVPGNDTASAVTTPTTSADLALSKTAVGEVVPGDQADYAIAVANAGSSDAQRVVVTDLLPEGVSFVSSTDEGGRTWTCSSSPGDGGREQVGCELTGPLADGDAAALTLTVALSPDTADPVVNSATVSSDTADPIAVNNTDSDSSAVTLRADLALTKTHPAAPVVAGQTLAYTLRVDNTGPSNTDGTVTVTDRLPVGMSYAGVTAPGWDCSAAAPNGDGQLVTCSTTDQIRADESATIVLRVDVDPAAGPATLTNRASVSSEDDPDPNDNSATDPTTVVDLADLVLQKEAAAASVVAGTVTTFTLTVTNDGPSDADDVTVVDTLPAGMTLLSAAGTGWACGVDGSVVTCSRDSLAAGAGASFDVRVRVASGVPAGTELENTATAGTSTDEDAEDDNSDAATVTALTETDLSLAKSHRGDAVAGEDLTFLLDVANAGPSDAVAPVTLVDELPASMSFRSATGGDWACGADGRTVTCTSATPIAAGSDAERLELTVAVAPNARGTDVNEAGLGEREDDVDGSNGSDTDEVPVSALGDLSLVKSSIGTARIGSPLDFTFVVRNAGPSDARDVTVDDELPTGLGFAGAAGEGWDCSADGQRLTCLHDEPLAAHSVAPTLTVTVDVAPAAYPVVRNVAAVSSDADDPTPGDATDDDEVTVSPMADLTVTKSHDGNLKVGEGGGFRIAVTNHGPTEDPGPVTVTDQLPVGLAYADVVGEGWTCAAVERLVSCEHPDALAVDATTELDLLVSVEPEAYPSVTNTVTVSGSAEDPDGSNDTATDVATALPLVALSLSKEMVEQTGAKVTYELTVRNEGPNQSVDPVVLVDRLPSELVLLSTRGSGWTCEGTRAIRCVLSGTLEVHDSAVMTLRAQVKPDVPAGTEIVNVAFLDSGDTTGAIRTDSAPVTVLGSAGTVGVSTASPDASPDDAVAAGLGDTGGPELWLAVVGLLLLGGGAIAVYRSRQRPLLAERFVPRHRAA